jgi:hypothetical protein
VPRRSPSGTRPPRARPVSHPPRVLATYLPRLLALALVAACAASHVIPPPPAPPLAPSDEVVIGLFWSAPVDLDLYVTDPGAVTVYFANASTPSGGRLLADMRCGAHPATAGGANELVGFTDALPGVYRVGVDFIDSCGQARVPVAYRVVADVDGKRLEAAGTIGPEEFEPLALEFTVPEQTVRARGEEGPS